MAVQKFPGVFIEEIPKLPPSVGEADSALPVFIGYTEKAKRDADDDLLFKAERIQSFLEFENLYGGPDPNGFFILPPSLRLFYDNGGGECFVLSVGKYPAGISKTALLQGLDIINSNDAPTLLLFPDAIKLPGLELYEVQRKALEQAARLQDRFCILDLKYAANSSELAMVVSEFRDNIGLTNLSYGAAYTPHLGYSTQANLFLPASAAIAGIYCSVDRSRGVWKAPANIAINQISSLAIDISNQELESLNVDPQHGKSINVIRYFPGKGFLVWGARTLAGNDNEWRYISVRRLFIMVEESVRNASEPFVFEPNDSNTWVRIKAMIENYFTLLWRNGALMGAKAEHAFYVKVGLNETMTHLDILEGRLIIEFGLAVIRPAEFIIARITLKTLGE